VKTSTKNLNIAIVSDLYSAGFTVDGDEFIAETFYILAEDSLGNRWRLGGWNGAEKDVCEETGETFFVNIKDEAEKKAQRLLDRIQNAGEVDLENWSESRPAYGSVAYQQYGQAADVAWEKSVS
jgi:hypothetical protein